MRRQRGEHGVYREDVQLLRVVLPEGLKSVVVLQVFGLLLRGKSCLPACPLLWRLP